MVHVAIVLLLALIPLRNEVAKSLVLFLGNTEAGSEGDSLSSFNIAESEMMQGENEGQAAEDLALTASDLSNITPEVTEIGIELATPDFSIKKGLTGRSGTMKGALLQAYGGSKQTEEAVALGLEWLERHQLSDGSWSLVTPFSDGGVRKHVEEHINLIGLDRIKNVVDSDRIVIDCLNIHRHARRGGDP